MRLLDRYIIWEYVKIFLIITMAFSVLFLVIDISDRMPRLLRKGATMQDMFSYFMLRLPYLFTLTSPVVVLLSGLFLMDALSKYSESIAIRAAGISIFRMVLPLLLFGLFFSGVVMIFSELVLPKAEEMRHVIYTEKIKKMKVEDKKLRSHIHYIGSDNNLYYIDFFDGYRNTLKTIDITTFDGDAGRIQRKITANSASWSDSNWVFENCHIRSFHPDGRSDVTYFPTTTIEEVDVTPIDFIKSAKKPMQMNYYELRDYINRLKKIGENYRSELVELYLKISFPFANFIIMLFSIPLVSASTRSKGRGIIFGLGLLVCFLYLSVLRICQSLGHNGVLSPALAAWMPNLIFLAVGSLFVAKAEV